jgi:hypothetical protein
MTALIQIRADIAKTKQAILQIGQQPLNEAETRAQVDAAIARAKRLFDIDHLGINLAHPGQIHPGDIASAAFGAQTDAEKAVCILATFAEDRMRELLTASAMKFADPKAPPEAKRGDQILALQQRLLELERDEEVAYLDLEAKGVAGIARRPDADMAAILLIDDD